MTNVERKPASLAPGPKAGDAAAPAALYVHIPFCRSRCHYCDFNTYAGLDGWMGAYVEALCREAGQIADSAGDRLHLTSLYLGGGTPSRLSPSDLTRLAEAIGRGFLSEPGAEWSLEANPGELALPFLDRARALGFNRISLGMQSGDDDDLRLLGRRHTHSDTVEAVLLSRQAGFTNLNLDLIAGVPGQDLPTWMATVESALDLSPDHLSVYALTVEPGTALASQIARRRVVPPDDDLTADMLDWLEDRLEAAGLLAYEISNWARGPAPAEAQPDFACRHNLTYWRNESYLGLGAGAHAYAAGVRTSNARPIADYVNRIRRNTTVLRFPISPAADAWRAVGEEEAARDSMLLGLRLTRTGVSRSDFVARHGLPAWETMVAEAEPHVESGLLEWREGGGGLRLTRRGRRLGNRVFQAFV